MSCLSKGNQIFKLLLKTNHQLNKNACITACSAGMTSILNNKTIHDDSKNKTNKTLDPKKFNRVSLFIDQ
jgi:NADH:ubiquinone oxidoreductase subunit E